MDAKVSSSFLRSEAKATGDAMSWDLVDPRSSDEQSEREQRSVSEKRERESSPDHRPCAQDL